MKLRTTAKITELYGIGQDSIYVIVSNHRKEHGVTPSWYVTEGNTVYVDEQEFFKYRRLEAESWKYTTEYLYWWLTYEPFCMTESYLSGLLAERSHKFKSVNSWQSFFTHKLFRQNTTMLDKRYTMTMDFLRLGTQIMQILINEAKNGRYFDQKEFDRRTKRAKNNTASNPTIQKRGIRRDEAISA